MPVPTNYEELLEIIQTNLIDNSSGLITEPKLRFVVEQVSKFLDLKTSLLSASLNAQQMDVWQRLLQFKQSDFYGTITTSSTFPLTGNLWGIASPGTYPNAGGLNVVSNTVGFLTRTNGAWKKVEVSLLGGVENMIKKYISGSSVYNIGATGNGVTNDALAINYLVDSVVGNDGGIIYFLEGIFMMDTPIVIPYCSYKVNITLKGAYAPNVRRGASDIPDYDYPNGCIIKTSAANGILFEAGPNGEASNVCLTIENMSIRINSSLAGITGINAYNARSIHLKNVIIDNNKIDVHNSTAPSLNSTGIIFPFNSSDSCTVNTVFISGFYDGVRIFKNVSIQDSAISYCYYGIKVLATEKPLFLSNVSLEFNKRQLYVADNSSVSCSLLQLKYTSSTVWNKTDYELEAGSSAAIDAVVFNYLETSGVSSVFRILGTPKMCIRELGDSSTL